MRKKRLIAVLMTWILLLTGCAGGSAENAEDSSKDIWLVVLDVGEGLSVLVESDGHYMIYDGGGGDSSSYVVSYLNQHEVASLDYMFVSHYDEDHINGLIGVLNTTSVELAVTPDYEADSKIYESFRNMMKINKIPEDHPQTGDEYSLGDATIQVLAPESYDNENENDNSIAVKISYGSFSCVITGDAESSSESAMLASGMDLDTEVYVVGHHGSSSSSSRPFVNALSPEYALISVGADNSYGHPADKTINTLTENNISILRTDISGEIYVYSDGTDYWIECNEADREAVKSYVEEALASASYVLNTKSMKFHLPDCDSISQMSESNKAYSTKKRDEIIADGFSPCRICNP